MKPELLQISEYIDTNKAYRGAQAVPILAEVRPGGAIAFVGPRFIIEVPGSTIKQQKGLAKAQQREFDTRTLVTPCERCSAMARIYRGMEQVARQFKCVNCGEVASEPAE